MQNEYVLIGLCMLILLALALAGTLDKAGNLNGIKSKTVGDGQHGTARFYSGYAGR